MPSTLISPFIALGARTISQCYKDQVRLDHSRREQERQSCAIIELVPCMLVIGLYSHRVSEDHVEFTFVAIRRSCIYSTLFGSIYFAGCLPPLCSVWSGRALQQIIRLADQCRVMLRDNVSDDRRRTCRRRCRLRTN